MTSTSKPPAQQANIAVLGGGPAGLMSALTLAKEGHQVTLLEAAPNVGGMAASIEIAGQRVDLGSHRLHPATAPELMTLLQELLGSDLQQRERNGRILLRDRWVGFPLRTMDIARSLPPDFAARVAFDTATGPLRRTSDGSFAGEIRRRLGPTILREFYGPYARKLYGEDASMLTAELADRRVAASSPWSIIAKMLSSSRPDGRTFFYPKNGYGQISEALADECVRLGVDLRLNAPATGLTLAGDGWSVSHEGRVTDVDLVLSSIPVSMLSKTIEPAPPQHVVESVKRMRTRAMVLVYLVVPRPQFTSFDAHYLPGLDLTTARLSECKNYRNGPDPHDRTVLCAEIACDVDDELWSMDVDDLGQLVRQDLIRAGLPDPTPVEVQVRRLRHVYPVYSPAAEADRSTVDTWLASLPGLISFGRQGLGVPDNLHHVMAMGVASAQAIGPAGSIRRDAWSASLEQFNKHVVQD